MRRTRIQKRLLWVGLLLATVIVVAVGFLLAVGSRSRLPSRLGQETTPTPAAPHLASLSAASPVSPQETSERGDLAAIRQKMSGAADLNSARIAVARDLLATATDRRLDIQTLQGWILDPSESVIGRIVYSEFLIRLFPDDADLLDVARLTSLLKETQSPVLCALLVEILGMTGGRAALPTISDKFAMEAENVRLAATRAATAIGTEEGKLLLERALADEDYYRVRMAAIHGLVQNPEFGDATSDILQAVGAEKRRMKEAPPKGQSRALNLQLVTVSALRALAQNDTAASLQFRIRELLDTDNPGSVRRFAARALSNSAAPAATDALLTALKDEDETIRLCAAQALAASTGPKFLTEIEKAATSCRDTYVCNQMVLVQKSITGEVHEESAAHSP